MKKITVALCYDFDKTLATDDMQAFSFIPKLGISKEEFWAKTQAFTKATKCEPILAYLQTMIAECNKKGIVLTEKYLNSLGKNIKFYDGVTTFFNRINSYADSLGITLEHYIISSGNKEIISGCKIADKFTEIFGCEFLFNEQGVAYWPKNIVNYTQKTQYLFRICKGTTDITDNQTINKRVSKKHVEFKNMIYIGDGLTDIPSMTLVKEKGGISISVFTQNAKDASLKLLQDDRVNYICKSDFRRNSQLEKLIKLILDNITLREKLANKEKVY